MIGAIEKQKFVYILRIDQDKKIAISSPLPAHKNHTICFDIAACDVGWDNPIFASLEVDYGEKTNSFATINTGKVSKNVIFYELDLGLNHVARKYCEPVPDSAHRLMSVPGDIDGPGGVLVLCEDQIVYVKPSKKRLTCSVPR